MTMTSRSTGPKRKSANRAPYWSGFIGRVHRLLSLGYQRLCNTVGATALQNKKEPAITGHLVKAMKEIQYQANCPYFDIDDDPRLNDSGKEGEDREKIDIQITELRATRRGPRFHFEAKRLYHRSDSVSAYAGEKGLKALLTEYYAKGDDHAGMLGYVQKGAPDEWAEKIRDKLNADHQGYGFAQASDCWQKRDDESKLEHSYFSHHANSTRPITIHHTLLMCHG